MAILIPNYDLGKQIGKRVEFDATTVDELIRQGVSRFGEPFRKASEIATISVNGRAIRSLQGGKTRLKKDDAVWFVMAAGGG